MNYKIDVSKLLPGDIILAGYNDAQSKRIQHHTDSLFSHAMLVWHGSIIHSCEIVITDNPNRMLFKQGENVCVLRIKDEYRQSSRISELIYYARSFVGTLYDKASLDAMALDAEFSPNKNRQMCAKFVAQCFDHVFIDLVDDYERCTPQDLFNSKEVDVINNVLIEATPQDEEFANSPDVTYEQFSSIFSIINRLRKRFPKADIMSLNQLERFLEIYPEHDKAVVDIMSNTEYFNLWSIERRYCPYLYNIEAYKNYSYFDNKVEQAIQIRDESERIIEEKEIQIDYYNRQIKRIGQLDYYYKMLELQFNIISTAKERIAVANSYLDEQKVVRIKYPWSL